MNLTPLEIVGQVAEQLIVKNGQTTTLEVKNECHRLYPSLIINQAEVSYYMDVYANRLNPKRLKYTDNGVYRTYYMNQTPIANPVKVDSKVDVKSFNITTMSRTKIVQMLRDLDLDQPFAVTFVKNNDEVRTHIGYRQEQFFNNHGYIGMSIYNGSIRTVNPRTIVNILVNGKLYIAN